MGAGSNVKVHVPSPLSEAIGPAAGFQSHQGPVSLTLVAVAQTLVVINKGAATTVTVLVAVPIFPAASVAVYVIV